MSKTTEGTDSRGSVTDSVLSPGPSASGNETAPATGLVGDREREKHRKELLETLRCLKVDHRNPDLWMEAASLYMALGNAERALLCTKASVKVEAHRKEEDKVATRLADQLQRELGPHETVPCPNCETLLVLESVVCHLCGLEPQ